MARHHLKKSFKFSFLIAVITFVLAAIFSLVSSSMLGGVAWGIGLLIVFVIVLIGIVFDILGMASTAAQEAPLHVMAAEKVHGAKEAVYIVRNADKFSSFCNDVIGDISGIVSGTASAVVVIQIAGYLRAIEGSPAEVAITVGLTSIVAAVTVGGKAIGKHFAIHSSTRVILFAGKIVYFIENVLKIRIFPAKKKRKHKKAGR